MVKDFHYESVSSTIGGAALALFLVISFIDPAFFDGIWNTVAPNEYSTKPRTIYAHAVDGTTNRASDRATMTRHTL